MKALRSILTSGSDLWLTWATRPPCCCNHGTLAVGDTAAACWLSMFYLERACLQQTMALSAGRDGVLMAPDAAQTEVRSQMGRGMGGIGGLAWPGCLRQLERNLPGYDA